MSDAFARVIHQLILYLITNPMKNQTNL